MLSARKLAKWLFIAMASVLGMLIVALLALSGYRSWEERTEKNCPLLAQWMPISHTPIADNDYIEVFEWCGGPGCSYPNRVTVFGDGRVQRETTATVNINGNTTIAGCPLRVADRTAHIGSENAKRLISFARDGGFCRLCGSYTHRGFVSDGGSAEITLSISGKVHTVSSVNGNPPDVFRSIEDAVDRDSPLGDIADFSKFSPDRKAECDAFEQKENVELDKALHRKASELQR